MASLISAGFLSSCEDDVTPPTRKIQVNSDTQNINVFLKSLGKNELIAVAQAIEVLPEIDGDAKVCSWYQLYAIDEESAKFTKKPLLPKTYNDLPEACVLEAVDKGVLSVSSFDVAAIQKEVQWNYSHWFTYWFKSDSQIDYHEMLHWVADKKDIPNLENYDDADLEALIVKDALKDNFVEAWDKMSPAEREKAWGEMVKHSPELKGLSKAEIAGIMTGSGAVALATLSTTISLTGFAFYTTMSTVICSIGASVGATLPFATYMAASSTAATLGGPVGWVAAGGMLVATPFFFGWADEDKTVKFVLTKYALQHATR
ncbi:MAG: hypothetical protein R3Y56_10195 [Akkermansia sp.]